MLLRTADGKVADLIIIMVRLKLKSLRFHKGNITVVTIQNFIAKTVRF